MNTSLLRAATVPKHPPLVLLHGMLGAPASFCKVVPELDHPGAVIALVLPGHGRPASLVRAGFEANVRAVASALSEPCYVMGYSMGGRLALGLAAFCPTQVLGVVAVSAHTGLHDGARDERIRWEREQADKLLRQGLDAFIDQFESLPLFASQARLSDVARAEQRAVRCRHDAAGIASALVELGSGQMPQLLPLLIAARARVHFVAGALDARYVAHAQDAAQQLADASVSVIDDAGHNLTLETPTQLARICNANFRSQPTQGEYRHDLASV